MPIQVNYVECFYCPKAIRIDKMLSHLCTHAEVIISHMSPLHRNMILKGRIPLLAGESTVNMFRVCLHCKRGELSCSSRKPKHSHTECVKSFDKYESLFTSAADYVPRKLGKWKEIKKETYVEQTGKNLVLEKRKSKPVQQSNEPIVCLLTDNTQERIIAMWGEGRDPDDDVDEDEETIDGKANVLLNYLSRCNVIIHRNTSKINDLMSQLTHANEENERLRTKLRSINPS